jgi:hypothetical protein
VHASGRMANRITDSISGVLRLLHISEGKQCKG